MTDKTLPRGAELVNPPVRTGLMEFLEKNAPKEETVESDTEIENETSEDAETTEEVNQEEDSGEAVSEPGDNDASEGDGEQSTDVFEVKGQKVPLKDLLNAFETREEISRRFNEVGKKEQKIQQERERIKKEREELALINEKFEEMQELVLQGNPLGALQIALAMAPTTDDSKPQALEDLIRQAVAIADNFHGMTEEEQKLFLEKEELNIRKRKLDKKEKKEQALKAEQELKQYYDGKLEANNIKDEEIEKALQQMVEIPKIKEELEKTTDLKARVDQCVNWVLGQRLTDTVRAGIAKVDPKLAEGNELLLAVLDTVDAKCTVESVEALVREWVNVAQNGSAKKESAASTQGVEKKSTTPNRVPTEKKKAENNKPILSWDDLIAKHS